MLGGGVEGSSDGMKLKFSGRDVGKRALACDKADREHPEGDHGGKVERRNAGAYAEWHFVRVRVHTLRHVLERFSHEVIRSTASGLDHLETPAKNVSRTGKALVTRDNLTPEHVAARVGERFALLARDDGGKLLLVLTDEGLVPNQGVTISASRCCDDGVNMSPRAWERGEGDGGWGGT